MGKMLEKLQKVDEQFALCGTLEECEKVIDAYNKTSNDNYSFKCKFTRMYLQLNRKRGLGNGYAPYSYTNLFYFRGNSYQPKKLVEDLQNNPDSNFSFYSSHTATAYYPIEMFTNEIDKKWKIASTLLRLAPTIKIKKIWDAIVV